MSTAGQIIGGVVGGVIGYFVGGPAGAVYGFGIGAGIGAYVDPMVVRGPRLGDAVVQTSSVGGVIADGYGTFPTAGNIIWASPVIERKKKSGGKGGGGGSTETYHYYRSYAIGVCRGPINGFLMVKRNGKIVYDERPGGFGHSEKWLEKVEFHYGTEDQMPSPVMVAHLGVDNVPAFRGLAYIVVQEDDVTYTSGAVPQYEFVVQKLPDVYFTTEPYPQSVKSDPVFSRVDLVKGTLREVMKHHGLETEELGAEVSLTDGVLKVVYKVYNNWETEEIETVLGLVSGELVDKLRAFGVVGEEAQCTISLTGGEMRVALVSYTNWITEEMMATVEITSGELRNG